MRGRFRKFRSSFLLQRCCSPPHLSPRFMARAPRGHRSPQTTKLAAAAPKPAYDPHDLTGVWWGRGNNPLMGNPVPSFTAEGQKMFALNRPTGGPNALVPALGNDPMGRCDPLGYPRTMYSNGRSFEFIQTPYKIVQIFEWTRGMRDIWTDGRKIPEDVDPRWYGYAVGKWDGNTLVVNSSGYNDKTWLDGRGHPHSEDMTMEERYTHPGRHDPAGNYDDQRPEDLYQALGERKAANLAIAVTQGRDRTGRSLLACLPRKSTSMSTLGIQQVVLRPSRLGRMGVN